MNDKMDIKAIRKNKNNSLPRESTSAGDKNLFSDFLNKDIRIGTSRLSDKIKEDFYMELFSLLGAGIDIQTSLELIRDEQKKKKTQKLFDSIVRQVVEGSTLADALQGHKEFSNYEFHSIRIGEETGKLQQVLKELAIFFQKKIKQKRQLIGAVTYPAVVLVVAFGAVSFMISFVVPMFSDTFKRFGNDLPPMTRAVIAFSVFIKKFSGFFFLAIASLIAFKVWQGKKPWFRKMSATVLLKVPVIGSIIKKIYLARFANTMSLLTGARVPMVQAIQLTRKMITFYPIEQSLADVEEKITNGVFLYKSLSAHAIYPHKMISIVKVAEETNQLELFFTRLAERYSNEVEYETGLLSKVLEPLIIVVLGLVVGIILIAMYLPLFKLGQTF